MDVICHKNDESRQGIALILVVGMLGLMMVMAVAFAVFMRTERVAAGSFRTDVRARALLQVALSRAVATIDADMIATNRIYPTWDALYSGGTNYVRESLTKNTLDQIPLGALIPQGACLEGTANYVIVNHAVPGGSKGTVINLTDHSFGLITNVVSLGGGNNKIFHTTLSGGRVNNWASGSDQFYILQPAMIDLPSTSGGCRYGFVVINCSGLPDANYAGGMERGMGANAAEIQVQSLPGGVNTNSLVTGRQTTPYETHQELVLRGMLADGAFTEYPDSYVCYSSAATNDGKVYIGGTAAELVNKRNEIIGALTNMSYADTTTPFKSFTLAEAEVLFTNLIDYVDNDRIPGNFGGACPCNPFGPSVEVIPMANEVVVSNVVSYAFNPVASNYNLSGSINCLAEFALPFKGLLATSRTGFKYGIAVAGVTASAIFNPVGVLSAELPLSWPPALGDYNVKTLSGAILGGVVSDLSFTNLSMTCGVNLWIKDSAGNIVDVVTNAANPVISVALTPMVQGSALAGTVTFIGDRECVDPRLNYDSTMWPVAHSTRTALNTLGNANFWALYYMNKWSGTPAVPIPPSVQLDAQGRDGDTAMYVPVVGTNLVSVGELGYLFYGKLWETIRLFKLGTSVNRGQIHPVVDFFTTDHSGAGIPRGRVNINTRNFGVIDSILSGLPLDKPHGSGATVLTVVQQAAVNAAITNRSATYEFHSLSELGAIRWDSLEPTWDSLDKESIIRNICGLVNVRQNLFVILLYADVTKTDLAGNSASLFSGIGLAEVWRDPQDTNNHYSVNTHLFQIMESP